MGWQDLSTPVEKKQDWKSLSSPVQAQTSRGIGKQMVDTAIAPQQAIGSTVGQMLTSYVAAGARLLNKSGEGLAMSEGGVSFEDAEANRKIIESKINDIQKNIDEHIEPSSPEAKTIKAGIGQILSVGGTLPEIHDKVHKVISYHIGEDAANTIDDLFTVAGPKIIKGAGGVVAGTTRTAVRAATGAAAKETIQGITKPLTATQVGETLQKGVKSGLKSEHDVASAAYKARDALVNPNMDIPLTNVQSAVKEIAGGFNARDLNPRTRAAIKDLQNGALGSATKDSLEKMRTRLEATIESNPESVSAKAARTLSDALRKDIDTAVEKGGTPEAQAAVKEASSKWASYKQSEENIEKALGAAWKDRSTTGASLYQKLETALMKDPTIVKRVMKNLNETDRTTAREGILHNLGLKQGSETFDMNEFVKNYQKLNPESKRELLKGIKGGQEMVDKAVKKWGRTKTAQKVALWGTVIGAVGHGAYLGHKFLSNLAEKE